MRKTLLVIAGLMLFVGASFAQTCNSSTNRDSFGNPCTNFTTKGNFVSNGNPISYALATQDGVTNTSLSSQGIYNLTPNGQVNTLLPADPLVTLGYNVVAPPKYGRSDLELTQGLLTSFSQVNGPLVSHCGRLTPQTYVANYAWDAGTETIDPPDTSGNNTFDWKGTLSVPFTFAYCVSSGGRGGHSSPIYTVGAGTGELSATPSYVGGAYEEPTSPARP
jgi:hypothetical protein